MIRIVSKAGPVSNTGMNECSASLSAWLAATFVVAGLVKGVTGMGLPTVAMGVLGVFMPPAAAAAMLVIPSFVTNVWQLLGGSSAAALARRLWSMMAGIVLGTVAGAALLARADPRWSSLALGVALTGYAAYAWFSPSLSVPRRAQSWLSPLVGVTTGLVTGATGVFVVPAVPYLQALGLARDDMVQALGLSFTVSTVALAAGLAVHGAYRADDLGMSALALLPALAGMWLGQKIRSRISAATFRRCFLLFLGGLGLELASRFFLS